MKKIIPALATVTLTGMLVSCGAPSPTPEVPAMEKTQPAPEAAPVSANTPAEAEAIVNTQAAIDLALTNSGVAAPAVDVGVAATSTATTGAAPAPAVDVGVAAKGTANAGTAPTTTTTPAPTKTDTTAPAPAPAKTDAVAPAPAATSAKTTTKVVGYQSPAGPEEMTVTITVDGGVITSASVKPMATHAVSAKLQGSFAAGVGAAVGKPVAGFSLDAVGGASLATKAFNAYVQSL